MGLQSRAKAGRECHHTRYDERDSREIKDIAHTTSALGNIIKSTCGCEGLSCLYPIIYRWRITGEVFRGFLLSDCERLEPQTSTVSKGRYYVVPTTWKAFRTPLVRGNAAKPDLLQVKLQVKKFESNGSNNVRSAT